MQKPWGEGKELPEGGTSGLVKNGGGVTGRSKGGRDLISF